MLAHKVDLSNFLLILNDEFLDRRKLFESALSSRE